MIHGDKNYLKATLTKGMLELQTRLINLYVGNLQSIGTQAALIGAFSFAGIGEITMPTTGYTWIGLEFLYDCFIHATLCLSIFATAQSTLVTMHGPAVALKGAEFDTVLFVANKIRDQRRLVLFIGAASLTCIFLATIFNFWAKIPPAVALSTTIVYVVGYAFTVREGLRCYDAFHPGSKTAMEKVTVTLSGRNLDTSVSNRSYQRVNSAPNQGEIDHSKGSNGESEVKREEDYCETVLSAETVSQQEASRTRARGMLWWRQPLSDGGKLLCRYAVLERGMLDLYKSEKDFVENNDPINKKPFKLWQYKLETDYSKFPKGVTSLTKKLRKITMNQGEFAWPVLLASEYDLRLAVNKFKFALLPKIYSELAPLEAAEFMANDEEEYKLWTKTFSRVIRAYEYLEEVASLEATMKGSTNVELIVKAANI